MNGDQGSLIAGLIIVALAIIVPLVGFGFAGRAIMRTKHRSTAVGFGLGFSLGVIGLLILAFLPRATPPSSIPTAGRPGQIPAPAREEPSRTLASLGEQGPAPVASKGLPSRALSSLALVTLVGYAVLALVLGQYRYMFGVANVLTLLILAGGIAIGIWAMVRPQPVLIGAAVGTATAVMGAGICGVHGLANAQGYEAVLALPFDLVALVAAIMITVAAAGPKAAVPTWWRSATLVIGIGFACVVLLAANVLDPDGGRRFDPPIRYFMGVLDPQEAAEGVRAYGWLQAEYGPGPFWLLITQAIVLAVPFLLAALAARRARPHGLGFAGAYAGTIALLLVGYDNNVLGPALVLGPWRVADAWHGPAALLLALALTSTAWGFIARRPPAQAEPANAHSAPTQATAFGSDRAAASPTAVPTPTASSVAPAPTNSVPAGWFPDPYQRFDQRYWDGGSWTPHVTSGASRSVDPNPT